MFVSVRGIIVICLCGEDRAHQWHTVANCRVVNPANKIDGGGAEAAHNRWCLRIGPYLEDEVRAGGRGEAEERRGERLLRGPSLTYRALEGPFGSPGANLGIDIDEGPVEVYHVCSGRAGVSLENRARKGRVRTCVGGAQRLTLRAVNK